jgi:hypothetical protein
VFDIKDYDDETIIFFTPDKTLHAVSQLVWNKYWDDYHGDYVARFLLIFYEIIENNVETLPHLEQISLDLFCRSISSSYIWVDSVYKDGILSASLRECDTEGQEVVERSDWEGDDSESNDSEDE